ncbi:FecR family protein [Flavitalea flava]
MQSHEHFLSLLDKFTAGTVSAEDQNELFSLIASGQYDHVLAEHFKVSFAAESLGTPSSENMDPANPRSEAMQKILKGILAEKQHPVQSQYSPDYLKIIQGHKSGSISSGFRKFRWVIAASITGLLAIGIYLVAGIASKHPGRQFSHHFIQPVTKKVNPSSPPLTINLEDGSLVILQPGSSLQVPDHFLADKRDVYLEGEAFFDIRKNADRPFYVYNGNLVTHVLGTSFSIKTDPKKKSIEVSVLTGKVQVYENREILQPDTNKLSNGVILMPNQKVIYQEDDRQFSTMLVSNPQPLARDSAGKANPNRFVFEDAQLSTVFRALETDYGIEIIPENENINHCLFTGDIVKHGLYEKLDIICQSVKLSYEFNGTKILIKGKGCN